MALNTATPELQFALHAAQQASLLVKQVQAEMVEPALTKDDRSPVTIADFAAQAVVGRLLEEAFPGEPLVAEEDSHALQEPDAAETLAQVTQFVGRVAEGATTETACAWIDHGNGEPGGRFWVLDPIDGTKGFLRGAQYAVALALIENGQVQLGVLGCPNLTNGCEFDIGGPGSIIAAVRGEGTWTTPLESPGKFTQLQVSDITDTRQARMLRSVESGHTNVGRMGQLIDIMQVEADPVLMDSQAKYAVLAAGKGDLLFRLLSYRQPDYREKIWDQAAGSIVVEEAGGRITDLNGKPLDFTQGRTLAENQGVCASNGTLHDAAVDALSQIVIRPSE
jgi:3'(2'), 5'-bisphosphate nucleotidase